MDYVLVKVGLINNNHYKLQFDGSVFYLKPDLGKIDEDYVGIELLTDYNSERKSLPDGRGFVFYTIPYNMLDVDVQRVKPKTFSGKNLIYQFIKPFKEDIDLIEKLFLDGCFDIITYYKYAYKNNQCDRIVNLLHKAYYYIRPLCEEIMKNEDYYTLKLIRQAMMKDVNIFYSFCAFP